MPLPVEVGNGLQARAGIGRAGAYRANYYIQNVLVTIGNTDITGIVELNSLSIAQHLNDQPDTCSFVIKPQGGVVPQAGQPVTIASGGKANAFFKGQVLRLTEQYVKLATGVDRAFHVECIDGTLFLDSQGMALAHYTNKSASDIAKAWVNGYFRTDSIDPGLPVVADFPVTNELVSGMLRRLVNLVDGGYFTDAYWNVHLFGVGGDNSPKAGTRPQPITLVPGGFANSPRTLTEFALTGDISQIRTRIVVEGKSTQLAVGTPSGQTSTIVDASAPVDVFLVGGGGGGGSSASNAAAVVEIFGVAGGGGGGSSISGGGGGGGGGWGIWNDALGPGTFPVVVGPGGGAGISGGNSTCNGHVCIGGGRGGNANEAGTPGGSGGGGNGQGQPGGAGSQGFGGGFGDFTVSGNTGGGGGGGGAVGSGAGGAGQGGQGGQGVLWGASGTNLYYAGGGGGRGPNAMGAGGFGGGGAGGVGGTNGYGGGGGGQAPGGSGVVIISYPDGALIATGGVITHVGGKTIHTFTASGSFVIATNYSGGGGGGGGYGALSQTIKSGTYPVVIGAGGGVGANGSPTVFNGVTVLGGGRGGNTNEAGQTGGCGGGGNNAAGGNGTSGQGYNGGAGTVGAGAGGGGCGGNGAAAPAGGQGGAGGIGVLWGASGSNVYYGGGGGGYGSQLAGAGGPGGGGQGAVSGGANGTGGGGGAFMTGGNGVVILSYADGALNATGGTITHVGGKTIHTFTVNDNFVIAGIVLVSAPPFVTDMPVIDASQLDPNPGTVRMAFQLFNYLGLAGPVVPSGANPPGSKLTTDAAINATVINVVNANTIFTAVPGWALLGGQYIRFTGANASQLTGIPAVGFGSIANPVSSGSEITWVSTIVLASAPGILIDPPVAAGENVTQRIQVDDTVAQSALATIEGGNGVHAHYIQDGRLSLAGMRARANAELTDFRTILRSATWTTYDNNAERGRMQSVNAAGISITLLITGCTITFPKKNYPAKRQCEGATVRTAALLDAIVTSQV